jgi:glycosyltransferase involved in cell wall biosynthesis
MGTEVMFVTIDASQTGGIERSLANLLPDLHDGGASRVTLVSCFGDPRRAQFSYGDVPTRYLSGRKSDFITGGRWRKLRDYALLAFNIARLRVATYDRIVAVYPVIALLLLVFHPRMSRRIYAWEHSQPDAHSALLNLLRRRFYARLGGLIVLTERQRQAFHGLVGRISVLPNASKPLGVVHRARGNRPWHIIGVGRLSPEKGFDRLLTALGRLRDTRTDWTAMIYGDGPCAGALKAQIAALGLAAHVSLHEGVNDPQEIYGQADITAVCSRSEVFGMVIIESMSVGVPIIAYDGGEGPRDLIRHGIDGHLVADGNADELCKGLQRLMDDPAYYARLAAAGLETSQAYMADHLVRRWRQELSHD